MPEKEYDENRRKSLSALIMKLFEHWGISNAQQLCLLGINPKDHDALQKYKSGAPLPEEPKILDRVDLLLDIHKLLRLLFPENEDLRYTWVSRRNRELNNKTPLEIMIEGLEGIRKVSNYLNHMVFS